MQIDDGTDRELRSLEEKHHAQLERFKDEQAQKSARAKQKDLDAQRRAEYFAKETAAAGAARATEERMQKAARDRAKKLAEMEAEMQAVRHRMRSVDTAWEDDVKKQADKRAQEDAEAARRAKEQAEAEARAEEAARIAAREAKAEAVRRKATEEAAIARMEAEESLKWQAKEKAAESQTFSPKRRQFHEAESIPEDEQVGGDSTGRGGEASPDGPAQLAAVKRAYEACEKRLQTLKAESAPHAQVAAAIAELKELRPRLRQLQASMRIGSMHDMPEARVPKKGSRASELSARRLQRQRAREANRFFTT